MLYEEAATHEIDVIGINFRDGNLFKLLNRRIGASITSTSRLHVVIELFLAAQKVGYQSVDVPRGFALVLQIVSGSFGRLKPTSFGVGQYTTGTFEGKPAG
jgi:hypothetical protein